MRGPLAVLVALSAALPGQHLSAPTGVSGGHVTGGAIEAQVSTGDPVAGGVSDITASIEDKGGYTGQLHDPKSLQPTAAASTVAEGASLPLDIALTLDDDTTLDLSPSEVAWSVASGALTGIDSAGVADAALVFQDSPATAKAEWLGIEGTLALTVLDTDPDNFGSYAGDGIDDSWQVAFFGLDDPDAAPLADPDRDGQNNLLEFLATVDPTDPSSIFCTELSSSDAVTFSPVSPLRTYTLLASPDLDPANFAPVAAAADDGAGERTLTEVAPSPGHRRFYRIDISN